MTYSSFIITACTYQSLFFPQSLYFEYTAFVYGSHIDLELD